MPNNTAKTELFGQWLSGNMVIADQGESTGRRVFVCSVTGSDAGGYGGSPERPVATLDYAIALCTANKHDIIYVMPGHSETLTAAVTCDMAGVRIVGLGSGLDRPEFTVGANGIDGFTVTTDNVTLENLYFNEATVATATANINIAAANVTVRKVHMDMGANDRDGFTLTAAAEKPTIEDCSLIVTADGPDTWITFEGVIDMPVIRRNYIVGCDGTNVLDDGVMDFGGLAITNPIVMDNVFDGADQVLSVLDDVGAVVGDVFAGNRYGGSATDGDTVTLAATTLADNGITAAKIAADAITASEIADAAIDAATFAADALQAMQDEAEDALEGENLDHVAKTAVANNADMTTEVTDGTIVSNILSKTSDTSSYSPTTDSLEMLSDKAGGFSGDGGANQDDSVKASLDLAHTDLDAILADTGTDGVAIADGYITSAKFGASAIDSTVMAAGAIDAAAIAAGAIDADAIADNAIDAGALAADCITNAKIADDAIAAENLATGAITADAFAADAIVAATLATGALTADAFAADAIVAATLATDSITADALAADAVAEVADGVTDEALTGHKTQNTVGAAMSSVEMCCEKSDGAVLLGDDPIFTIAGGPIHILEIAGIVTTNIGAGATNVKLQLDTTTPAATVELNAGTVDIDADAAGTSYRSINTTGIFTPVTAGFVLMGNSFATNPTEYFAPAGTIQFNSDAARDGVIKWYLRYRPLSPNSVVTAAA